MSTNALWTIGIIGGLMLFAVFVGWYRKVRHYQVAKLKIFKYVKAYKGRCTGVNRFLVNEFELQNAFREYNIDIIEKVFQELIIHRVIERDPTDQEWCIR